MGPADHFVRWLVVFSGWLAVLVILPAFVLALFGQTSWDVFVAVFGCVFSVSYLLALWKSWAATKAEATMNEEHAFLSAQRLADEAIARAKRSSDAK
ncbi:hypothetical protein R70006_05073 [Paraburkholderia domus]|uniref:hypothetical protein n=1 Tax=Paraburkholderia domus TaxID=2793075 RepID=UPI001912301B|nr:hypothetical protein [Paraburkholderia domus]MBK5051690.1 hypothetical protein [Burkholderia sp. R-70006]CAE6795907.1 hypothetical protein R70006_05073 [Paraburkholderia domus]